MTKKRQIFQLNGNTFSKKDLELLCKKKLSETHINDWEKDCYSFILDWFSPKTIIKVQTSGSTGKPKEYLLEKKFMEASAQATIDFFNLKPGNTALLCLPVKYIAGKMMIVRSLLGGLDLLITKPSSVPDLKKFQKIDFCAMVPNQIAGLLETKNGAKQLELIENLLVGGSFLPSNLETKIIQLNTKIWQTYGMTETITHIGLRKINEENSDNWYTPLSGVETYLDNRCCLIIHAEKIGVKHLVTNDLAEVDKFGKFKILGRIDNVVISGGVKLIPEEIENKLTAWIESDFYLSAMHDEKLGNKLVLYIEDKGKLKSQIYQLWEKIEARLSGFEIPKEIIFIEHFPRTDSGKIIRK